MIDLLLLLFSISPVWLALKDSDKGPAEEYSENTAKNTTELFLFLKIWKLKKGKYPHWETPIKTNSKRGFNQHFIENAKKTFVLDDMICAQVGQEGNKTNSKIEKVKRFGKKATWALRPFSIEQTRANIRGSDWELN